MSNSFKDALMLHLGAKSDRQLRKRIEGRFEAAQLRAEREGTSPSCSAPVARTSKGIRIVRNSK